MYRLKRTLSDAQGTFGIFYDNAGKKLCLTCEDPWNDNQRSISCIPKGFYKVIRHHSTRFPNTWEITGVPNRTAILIHAGNTIYDTHGCVLVGDSVGELNGLPAVLNSKKTMAMLNKVLPDQFDLSVED